MPDRKFSCETDVKPSRSAIMPASTQTACQRVGRWSVTELTETIARAYLELSAVKLVCTPRKLLKVDFVRDLHFARMNSAASEVSLAMMFSFRECEAHDVLHDASTSIFVRERKFDLAIETT